MSPSASVCLCLDQCALSRPHLQTTDLNNTHSHATAILFPWLSPTHPTAFALARFSATHRYSLTAHRTAPSLLRLHAGDVRQRAQAQARRLHGAAALARHQVWRHPRRLWPAGPFPCRAPPALCQRKGSATAKAWGRDDGARGSHSKRGLLGMGLGLGWVWGSRGTSSLLWDTRGLSLWAWVDHSRVHGALAVCSRGRGLLRGGWSSRRSGPVQPGARGG